MNVRLRNISPMLLHGLLGVIIGVFILHPVTMVIYWFEFNHVDISLTGFFDVALARISHSFHYHMLTMSGSFAIVGGLAGLGSGVYYQKIKKQNKTIKETDKLLQKGITAIINDGVNEKVDFKPSFRYDFKKGTANKELETEILKSITGLLNNKGGLLIIGVDDYGKVKGLANDYIYLNRNNKFGFEQRLVRLITGRLGGDLIPLLHFAFHSIVDYEVCSITIEPSPRPVYLKEGDKTLFYLRTGNLTKPLNTQETVEFLNTKKQHL